MTTEDDSEHVCKMVYSPIYCAFRCPECRAVSTWLTDENAARSGVVRAQMQQSHENEN